MIFFFKSLTLKTTLIACALGTFFLDILSSLYFIQYWKAQGLSERMLSLAFIAQGESISELDPHFLQELQGMIENTGAFILTMFLIVNSVFYLYLPYKKKWSWQYVMTYTSTASLFCLVTAFEQPNLSLIYTAFNWGAIFLYALLAFILWCRKSEVQDKGFRFKTMVQ